MRSTVTPSLRYSGVKRLSRGPCSLKLATHTQSHPTAESCAAIIEIRAEPCRFVPHSNSIQRKSLHQGSLSLIRPHAENRVQTHAYNTQLHGNYFSTSPVRGSVTILLNIIRQRLQCGTQVSVRPGSWRQVLQHHWNLPLATRKRT